MKRFSKAIVWVLILLFALGTAASAVEPRARTDSMDLGFSGTTANCKCTITDVGKNISVTMELKRGNAVLETWTASGRGRVSIDETRTVISGVTYTLVVSGTSGGTPFTLDPIVKKCP